MKDNLYERWLKIADIYAPKETLHVIIISSYYYVLWYTVIIIIYINYKKHNKDNKKIDWFLKGSPVEKFSPRFLMLRIYTWSKVSSIVNRLSR